MMYSALPPGQLDRMKYFDKDEKGQPFDIPNMYTVQCVKLDEHERSDLGGYVPGAISNNMPWANNQRSRNNKQLFTVSLRSEVDPPYAFLSSELRFCGVWVSLPSPSLPSNIADYLSARSISLIGQHEVGFRKQDQASHRPAL